MMILRIWLYVLIEVLAVSLATAQTRINLRSQSNWNQVFPSTSGMSGAVLTNNGSTISWQLFSGDLGGQPGSMRVLGLQGRPISSASPNNGDVLRWNISQNRWEGAASIASFLGRTGSVVPQSGDYGAAQVTNAVDQSGVYLDPSWIGSLSWTKITGVPSISINLAGTANQLVVTGGSSPVLSIANPFSFPGVATFAAATTSAPSFNILQGVAPLSPSSGAFWAVNNTLWWHNGAQPVAFLNDDGAGNVTIPGTITTGVGGNAAGSVVALRGTGAAKVGLQGSLAGEWDIVPPANFNSWSFTPPISPCASHQWWTTDTNGVGSCIQPSFSDVSGALTAGQLAGTVGGDLSGSLPNPKVAAVNGTSVPSNAAPDQTVVTTLAGVGSWQALPSCGDSTGNHLNYNTATHSFSCGTSSSIAGTVAGDLSGTLPNPKVVAVNGTSVPSNAAPDQTVITTLAGVGSWQALPSCGDSAGNHLNYNTATHSFSCGTSSSSSGTVGGDLSGSLPDPKVAAVNGTSVPSNAAPDQTVVTTASGVGSWQSIPSCIDSGGNHLNYNPATHTFFCGTSGGTGSGAGTVTHSMGALTANAPIIGNGVADVATGSATGNTTLFVTGTGTRTSGNCAKWDANGNLIDAGAACGSGSSGTILLGGSLGLSSLPASTVSGYTPFGSATASYSYGAEWSTPVSGTLGNLFITVKNGGATQPASGSLVCTMYKNQAATGIAITMAAGYTSPSLPAYVADTVHTVSLAVGDSVSLRCQNNATAASIILISWGATIH